MTGRQTLLAGLLLAGLIAAAYGASLGNELVFDELMFMERDQRVHRFEVDRIFLEALWSEGENDNRIHQYYRPLQLLPLAVSYNVFGTAGWPSHLLNLLVHLFNCLLALTLYRHVLGSTAAALLAAMFFSVHPAYSEAVLWVSDIAGLGAAFCALAVVRLHVSARRERWYGWILSPALLLCGLWFKESGILAVVLVVLYDLVVAADRGFGRIWRMRWRYAVFLPAFTLYLALRLSALGGALPGIETVPLTNVEMLLNAVALLPRFASTLLWPFDLNMYHDFDAIHAVGGTSFWLGAGILLAGAFTFLLALRRHRAAAFGIAWALLAAAPHLLIRWPQLNVFAERYLYLPSVGIFLAFGYLGGRLATRLAARQRYVLAASAAALLALFIVVDRRRTRDWRDEVTIYAKTLTQSTRAELIRTNLAVRYLEMKRYDDGIALLEDLLRFNPGWHETRHNLGLLYMGKGETDKALSAFEQARQRDPFKAATLLNLGYLYDQQGRREKAVETYLDLVDRAPHDTGGWYNLAVVALEAGQLENARHAVRRVLERSPADPEAGVLQRRIEAAGDSPAPNVQATERRCAEAKRLLDAGETRPAALLLRAAAWLDERSPVPHQYLANLYYLGGRLPAALEQMREAVRRAPQNELYRSNLAAIEKAVSGSKGSGVE